MVYLLADSSLSKYFYTLAVLFFESTLISLCLQLDMRSKIKHRTPDVVLLIKLTIPTKQVFTFKRS